MFGYVKPLVGELKVKEHEAYRAAYCGVCRACGGGGCGRAQRLAFSYDAVFLALLRTMLSPEAVTISRRRCLLHPFRPRPSLDLSPALSYSTSAAALLLSHSLTDHADDATGMGRIAIPILRSHAALLRKKAGGSLPESLCLRVEEDLSRLKALEAQSEASPDALSHPFADALGAVFACELEGSVKDAAYRLGYHLGKWIYFADALDDRAEDEKKKRFNPFRTSLQPERTAIAMGMEINGARDALSALPASDAGCRAILENILTLSLPETTNRLIRKAEKERS